MASIIVVILGALGLWFGMANPLCHIPPAALAFPFALTLLGQGGISGLPRRGQAFKLGWLTGFTGYSAALYWVAVTVHEFGMLPWLLAVPCGLLLGAGLGIFSGLFTLLVREVRARRFSCLSQTILLGLGWYLLEWTRGFVLTGFPWLPLASAFAPWPVMIQAVAVVGTFGLGGILAALAALAAQGRRQACLACGGLIFLAFCGWLWLMVPLEKAGAGVAVTLVQGNVNQNVKWEPAMQLATVARYVTLSRMALRKMGGASGGHLIIWPETSMPFDMEKDGRFLPPLRTFAQESEASLIIGSVGMDAKSRRYLNRAYLITSDGRIGGWYDKEHLVPFGEYVPAFLDLPALEFLMQGVGEFTPGKITSPLPPVLSNGSLVPGVLICYEGIFPELARARVRDGATVLVNISNDAWFGRTSAPEQHLHATLLRAAELGRPLARATNTGVSAFVDAHGRIISRTRLFATGALTGSLAPSAVKTPFYVLALWLPALASALFLFVWRRGVRRRLP